MASKVIVFGPTGNIGSVVARTAQRQGAKVFLAMRDPGKSIRGLSASDEKAGDYQRIQADLTQPDSVATAAWQSGATRAFIYVAHGSKDAMKSTLEALKQGGVEFVVFLSSYTIADKPEDVIPSDIIAYRHAAVELSLKQVFGEDHFVAIRPGAFATNTLSFKRDLPSGNIKMHCPDAKADFTTPLDMGEVSGTILVNGSKDGDKVVYLFGPEMVPQRDAALTVGKVLGRNLTITALSDDEALARNKQLGIPEVVSKLLVKAWSERERGSALGGMNDPRIVEQGVRNVEKYTGRKGQKYEAWVESYKDQFE